MKKKGKTKKKDKEEILHSTIGLIKKIPKHETRWEFTWRDIVRPLVKLVIFSIALTFLFGYLGLIISILLTIVFEIATFKQNNGLIEVVGTQEELPFYSVGFWSRLNSFFEFITTIFIFFDILVILNVIFG